MKKKIFRILALILGMGMLFLYSCAGNESGGISASESTSESETSSSGSSEETEEPESKENWYYGMREINGVPREEFTSEGLEYALTEDKTSYMVTNFDNSHPYVIIPEKHNGLPVTIIGDIRDLYYSDNTSTRNGFASCDKLEEVLIPNTVTRIVSYSFFECKGLRNITIPSSVTSMGKESFLGYGRFVGCVFSGCDSLKRATLYCESDYLTEGCFDSCAMLESVDMENSGIASIDMGAFASCGSLRYVFLPACIEYTAPNSFSRCLNLEKIYLRKLNVEKVTVYNLTVDIFCTPYTDRLEFHYYNYSVDEYPH